MKAANSFGQHFVITTFGESHGTAMGVVIDGCPSEVPFDMELLVKELQRRRPGQHGQKKSVVSDREEKDLPEVLSGVYKDKTLGTPIAIIIRNQDQRSKDYEKIANQPRPGHADDTWKAKFCHTDPRGGGRSSGRETAARVMGGSVAQMLLRELYPSMRITGFSSRIGPVEMSVDELEKVKKQLNQKQQVNIDGFSARFPHESKSKQVEELLLKAKKEGKSYGGVVEINIVNPPVGLGQPVFQKLKNAFASAFMSVGATAAVELGAGALVAEAEGSEFHGQSDSSHYGGVRGGISTGETITFKVYFKPTATVLHTAKQGRHDPCIVPRAIPVLEAMAALVLADHALLAATDRLANLKKLFK